jgi:hypothetical protein
MQSADRVIAMMHIVISLVPSVRSRADFSCKPGRKQSAHPHQVVASEGQQRRELNFPSASDLRSPQQANVLAPAEGCRHDRPDRPQRMILRNPLLDAWSGFEAERTVQLSLAAEGPQICFS